MQVGGVVMRRFVWLNDDCYTLILIKVRTLFVTRRMGLVSSGKNLLTTLIIRRNGRRISLSFGASIWTMSGLSKERHWISLVLYSVNSHRLDLIPCRLSRFRTELNLSFCSKILPSKSQAVIGHTNCCFLQRTPGQSLTTSWILLSQSVVASSANGLTVGQTSLSHPGLV